MDSLPKQRTGEMNMSKSKKLLVGDTIIVFGKIPVGEYRKFFMQALGDEYNN